MTNMLADTKPYVLLDDNTGLGGPSALYEDPVEIVRALTPADVPPALARLEAASREGLHAAGYFAYELGYALEPRLAGLMPQTRDVPLMWFGLFRAPRLMSGPEVETWLAERANGGVARLANITHSWDEAAYRQRFERAIGNILSGDIYQINLTFRARFRLEGAPVALYRELRQKQRVAYGGIIETGDHAILSASPELFIERYGRTIATRPMKGTSPRGADPLLDEDAKRVLATDPKQRAENLMIVDLMRNDLGRIAEVGSVEVTDLFTIETFKTLHQMTSGVTARLIEGVSLDTLLEGIFPPGSVTGAPKIRAMELIAELEDSPRGVYCGAIGRMSPDGHALFNVAIRTPVFRSDGAGGIVGEMGIGSGVVADSDGGREYAECLLKMRFLTAALAGGPVWPGAESPVVTPAVPVGTFAAAEVGVRAAAAVDRRPRPISAPILGRPSDGHEVGEFQIIETMLRTSAGIWLRNGHLDRLEKSAAHFGFAFDRTSIIAVLEGTPMAAHVADDTLHKKSLAQQPPAQIPVAREPEKRERVRLLLSRDGTVTVTITNVATGRPRGSDPAMLSPAAMRYVVSPTRLDSRNPWLRHKTTERHLYDREWQHYHDADGADEVVYLNERGELAEGSRTSIFIDRGGVLLTPPLEAGVLPGVLRAELIQQGQAVEARLTLSDLDTGTMYLGNSVRGLVPAEPMPLKRSA